MPFRASGRHPTIAAPEGETRSAREYLATAIESVLTAGAIQRAQVGRELEVRHKGDIDIVTEVDLACERAILALIRSRHPDHDIVTEETVLARTGSPFVWFIDPVDGTTNFAHRYPFFCSSVALTLEGAPLAGAVYDPVKDELFTAERGGGSRLNGAPLRVTDTTELLQCLLATGFPYDVQEDLPTNLRLFNRLMGQVRAVRRDGAAALDLCYVAAGRYDGFWEERLKPWDVMAGALVLTEAGGRITRFDGSPLGLAADEVLSSNGALHAALIEELRHARGRGGAAL